MFGAGKSAYSLVNYLLDNAEKEKWTLIIADMFPDAVKKLFKSEFLEVTSFSLEDEEKKKELIKNSDLVISMLPARFHMEIATECLNFNKNLITPSYVSKEMREIENDVVSKGLIFLNEVGLDPGIDHMSAMQLIHKLQGEGNQITAFESFTGGLIAPESDNNPLHYKFTWNPRNVITAGQGSAVKFLHNGKHKYIPYHQLFARTEIVDLDEYGKFEGLANRDSLKYIELYGLEGVKTMYRGTFRRPPFSKVWHMLIQLGATDDTYVMEDSENMTYREFLNSFLKYRQGDSIELKLAYYLHKDVDCLEMEILDWMGLFSDEKIGKANATPAQVLQHLLEPKLAMEADDKDMIVMRHLFRYQKNDGPEQRLESYMVVLGDDDLSTGMAKTVGLTIGISAKLILNEKINARGVLMPLTSDIYEPILAELEDYGIIFKHK